jgi:phosphoenolpyruvate synthase/pyruvate phosphate dikinase
VVADAGAHHWLQSHADALVPLRELGSGQASRFGGKAASLGAMLAEGVPALDGLAVSAEAYEHALDEAGAAGLAREFWSRGWSDDASAQALADLSEQIAQRLLATDFSALADAVLARLLAFERIEPELIVRSSAIGEDSARMSYAGQFVSQRCRADRLGLVAAMTAVWASCTAPHVAAYRAAAARHAREDAPTKSLGMGLAVQPHRHFSTSGLLFTQHPTVALPGWAYIEYLDEQPARLVSGETVPHACRVNANTGRLVWERRIEGRPVLGPALLKELLAGGERLKRLASADVDVEWGVLDDTVYFLQSRPATTRPQER